MELFHRCISAEFAEAEIHLSGGVYQGYVDEIYQEEVDKKIILVVRIKDAISQEGFALPSQEKGFREFRLEGCGNAVAINDGEYDCVWAMFNDGYISIYFSKPVNHPCFN